MVACEPNGIGVREEWDGQNPIKDDYHIFYHEQHIQAMFYAIQDEGCKVSGYLGWGLIS